MATLAFGALSINGLSQTFMNLFSHQITPLLTPQKFNKNSRNSADHLNNTKKAEIDVVLFNRVAKVGSMSLMQLLIELGKINNFLAIRDDPKAHETVLVGGPLKQLEVAEEIYSRDPPFSYSQHLAYINFTDLGLPKPIYINLVRHPIERVISWHYYLRSPRYYNELKLKFGDRAPPMPAKEFMDMDLNTCVKTNDPYCQFTQGVIRDAAPGFRRQALFFCGQNKATCMPFNSQKTLQQAKQNVEQDYAVVGTWEDPNITLSVFERYIPRFFKNAKLIYHLKHATLSVINKGSKPKIISDEVREILRRNFTREIEFYEFCKQRLYRQYAAISSEINEDDDYMLIPEVE